MCVSERDFKQMWEIYKGEQVYGPEDFDFYVAYMINRCHLVLKRENIIVLYNRQTCTLERNISVLHCSHRGHQEVQSSLGMVVHVRCCRNQHGGMDMSVVVAAGC